MRFFLALCTALALGTACRPDDVGPRAGGQADTATDTGSNTGTNTAQDAGATDAGASDGGTTGDAGSSAGPCANRALLGTWLSQGDDISPLFQSLSFDYQSVQAVMTADCAYLVSATTNSGDQYEISGTWTADESTTPGSIVQTQAQPYAATAEGIWQVNADTLTFEVVQTDPDYGFVAPTSAAGFGSTSGQGLSAGDNIQTYQRQ
ncbi:MAG: hypothetical protein GXP62_18995 [Oligoflexia bacterium]|nr:hypothetical protein [Oligoflexia bacterium]